MKSVIANHKELQVNLFYAITAGLQSRGPISGDLHIVPEVTEAELRWKVMRHPTVESCAVDGQLIGAYDIPRGFSQLNDIRLGVIVSYLRSQAEMFLKGVEVRPEVQPEPVE